MIKKVRIAVDHGNRNMKNMQSGIYYWTNYSG